MSNSIWVGKIAGKVLVFDPAIQLLDCPHVFLWDMHTMNICKYVPETARKQARSYKKINTDAYISAYLLWKDAHIEDWLKEETVYYHNRLTREAEELKKRQALNLTLEEIHKERLVKMGKEYRGVRSANKDNLRRRFANCYSCKKNLDNSVDIECVACDWILCKCGACGCGYLR